MVSPISNQLISNNKSQIAAVSYPAVLAEKRKPANQWAN